MSVLRLYEDAALTQIVSVDGDFSNPDDESGLDGTAGETAQKALWVAVEQTTLSAGIDNAVTTIPLAAARFADSAYPVILVGSEKMLITAGFGTNSLTVTRGHGGTTKAAHSSADPVYLAYNTENNSIDCIDISGTDESSRVSYCDDVAGSPSGSWEAPHDLNDLDHDESQKIWRRVVIPASTAAANERDLVHRLTCDIEETT